MEQLTRPGWDDYFAGIATAVAARADCRRRTVGCVLVKDHRIVSTGYNGGPSGGASCLAGECPRGLLTYEQVAGLGDYDRPGSPGYCVAVHAEANALLYADRADARGATAYITDPPCPGCQKLLTAAGIERVVYSDDDSLVSLALGR
jgi:dCMP deaminase